MQNPFITNTYYHVYNRAIGNEKAFLSNENYRFFLQKIKQYIEPIAHIYCYCLLPNHYHVLLSIKDEIAINEYKESLQKHEKLLGNFTTTEAFVLQQFSNMGNSYTKAFNKMHSRRGRLFMESLQRREITTDLYFTKVVHYIHANAVQHALVKNLLDWQHSSYASLISNAPTLLQREKVFEWFGSKEKFIRFHNETPIDLKMSLED